MRIFEHLESRWLPCTPIDVLAIVNTVNAGQYNEISDINADGMVSPLDALLAINEANRAAAAAGYPAVLHPAPGGTTGVQFSPCGSDYWMTVLARSDVSPTIVVAGTDYQPVAAREFGSYNAWDFQVSGRGRESLRILGEFPGDELLTLIVG